MIELYSYPKVWALGHAYIKELLLDDVLIEEKVDGSQFSFCVKDGDIIMKSKNAVVFKEDPGMFKLAAETVEKIKDKLNPDYIYRAEYLAKPKHNTLSYDRVPRDNLIVFDIMSGLENYLHYDSKVLEAWRIGLEVVPRLYHGHVDNVGEFYDLLKKESCLGGQNIEGFVVKNYNRFGSDNKVLLGKYVSEDFKETNSKNWGVSNPDTRSSIENIALKFRSPIRWDKSVNALRDEGKLDNSPRDIGMLLVHVKEDIKKECIDEIKDDLFNYAWKHVSRIMMSGFPQWYKNKLMESQFDNKGEDNESPTNNP